MKNKLKLLELTVLITALALAALVLTGCDDGGGTTGPDPWVEDKDGYLDLNKFLTAGVEDVGVSERFADEFTQNTVTVIIRRRFQPEYYGQSRAIHEQYMDWKPKGDRETEFANKIREIESVIVAGHSVPRGGDMVGHSSAVRHNNIVDALCELFENQNDANLFRARLDAYRTATYIDQRNQGDKGTGGQPRLDGFLDQIEQMTGKPTERGENMSKALITDLIKTIPQSAGPGRYNLLMQLNNFDKLRGFLEDAQIKGFTLSSARVVSGTRIA